MSFNRLRSDNDAYETDLRQSVGPAAYLLNTPRNDCETCYTADPAMRLGQGGATCSQKALVDVDSELMGISRKRSRCPTDQYLPSGEPFCNMSKHRDCRALDQESTRYSNPPCNIRGQTQNRWEWLPCDPQRAAIMPFPANINFRLVVKDQHRPCVVPPDEPTALPPPLPPPTIPAVTLPAWIPDNPKTLSFAECQNIAR